MKICFYPRRVQNQNSKFFTCVVLVSFVQHLCRNRAVRVALVSHLCHTRVTRVLLVSLVFHSCRSCRTRVSHVWHSCYKLDYIDIWVISTFLSFLFSTFSASFSYLQLTEFCNPPSPHPSSFYRPAVYHLSHNVLHIFSSLL